MNSFPRNIVVAFALMILTESTSACNAQSAGKPAGETPFAVVASPDSRLNYYILAKGKPIALFGLGGWGPNWGWVGVESKDWGTLGGEVQANFPFTVNAAKQQQIDGVLTGRQQNAQTVQFQIDLVAKTDVPLTMLKASLSEFSPYQKVAGGTPPRMTLTQADGKAIPVEYPFGIRAASAPVKEISYLIAGQEIRLSINPPLPVTFDNEARIQLAADTFSAGTKRVTLSLIFPDTATLQASEADIKTLSRSVTTPDWYAFAPTDSLEPSVLGAEEWLDKPAGKHGGVRQSGDKFQFTDGTPVKFWGTNLSYGNNCAPEKKDAEFTAARFARFGVNGVRLHKFTYSKAVDNGIGDADDATKMTPDGLDRLDYFASELKKRGVYFGWSHTYGFRPRPGNKARLLAYDEIEKNLGGNTYGLMNYAEDVQDLMIEMVVNLLKHKNPYTGVVYAKETALSFIELQNEDDIFFYTTDSVYQRCPTYAKNLRQRFAAYLRGKYKTDAAWRQAWENQIQKGESLAGEVTIQANPWFWGDGNLPKKTGAERRRLLDNAAFFHASQNKFYARFIRAIRAAGYEGPICGSPWQAPAMLPHYLNLRSDALAGYTDRHDYFGGGLNDTLMGNPGGGYLSTGLQQVAGRPFGLSEWIHVYPSLYSAEGPPLVAAYGMGLQGWDASYQFQSAAGSKMYAEKAGWLPWGVWEADTPTQIGQYPILSRMVMRGDVRESAVTSVRVVNLTDLANGKFNFSDTVEQQGDIKTFGGTVAPAMLAYGRAVVEFTDKPAPLKPVIRDGGAGGDAIISVTKQLRWQKSSPTRGYVIIDTPGTQGIIGFTSGKTVTLGNVTLTLSSEYASLLLTARGKNETLATTKSVLITALARSSNTGFTTFALDNRVLENGTGPILLEPVKATVALTGRLIKAVHLLDHDGRRTGKTLSVINGAFTIGGATDKTPFYELEMTN